MGERIAPASLIQTLVAFVNHSTAVLFKDYHNRPRQIQQPKARVLWRFILLIAGLLVLAGAVVMEALSEDPKRTARTWLSDSELTSSENFIEKHAEELTSATLQCSCTGVSASSRTQDKSEIIRFYTVSVGKDGSLLKSYSFDNITSFCNDVLPKNVWNNDSLPLLKKGCYKLIDSAFLYAGVLHGPNPGTMVQMRTTFLNPVEFMYLTGQIISASFQKSFNDLSDQFTSGTYQYTMFEHLYAAVNVMLGVCISSASWPAPSKTNFWQAANESGAAVMDLIDGKTALGVEFNWAAYVSLCAPKFCDQLLNNSRIYNLFRAMSQLGGFISAGMIVLTTVVWPVVCSWAHWGGHIFSLPTRAQSEPLPQQYLHSEELSQQNWHSQPLAPEQYLQLRQLSGQQTQVGKEVKRNQSGSASQPSQADDESPGSAPAQRKS